MNKTTPSALFQTDPVFIRMPSGQHRRLWPGSSFTYYNLRPLVSPGAWNNNRPPIRAYNLRKVGKTRGTVLIEHADLIEYLSQEFKGRNPAAPPLPPLNIHLPPVLGIPPSGGQCPVTQLKHTVMYDLSLAQSPYGATKIFTTRHYITGSALGRILMQTDSVLRFIRSCPPPQYRISPRNFPPKNPPQSANPASASNPPPPQNAGCPGNTTPHQNPQTA